MNLDLWILAVVGLFAAAGFYTGAIQQVSHWVGIAAAFLCSKPAAAALAPVLAARMGWPPSLTAVGLSAVSMPVILVCGTLLSRGILNAVIPGDQRNTPDRLAGLILGAGKAGVVVWAALSATLAFEKPLARLVPGAVTALRVSSAARFTRDHSFFAAAAPSALDKIEQMTAAERRPPSQRR